MIIVKVCSGLGNQLFQYALGRRLSLERGVPLKLDTSFYANQSLRQFHLNEFNIQAGIASPQEVAHIASKRLKYVPHFLYRRMREWLPFNWRRIVKERCLYYDPRVLKVPRSAYLVGYWQSEKYFKPVENLIRSDLTLKSELTAASQRIARDMIAKDSVSIHIRRGDFLTDPFAKQNFGFCGIDYYEAAVRKIAELTTCPHFFIFSDDVGWARDNLQLGRLPNTFVTHNGDCRDYEDLVLMSHCKHHIIANSTFSWWAAWLNSNPTKIVIAPKRWHHDPALDTRTNNMVDFIPHGWLRV